MAPTPVLANSFNHLSSGFAQLPDVTFGPFNASQYTPSEGSCGWTNSSTEYVVSIKVNSTRGDAAFCGQEIEVETKVGSVVATIVDTCLSCGYDYLALSEKAFSQINEDEHKITASYTFTEKKHASAEKKNTKSSSSSSSKKDDDSSSSLSKSKSTPSSSSSSPEWTPSSSSSSSSKSQWSSSSSSSKTPEWTPSSSSKTPEWTPSSSSKNEWTPSPSSTTPEWTPTSSSKTPEWSPSSSSQQQAAPSPQQQQTQSSGGYSGTATYFYQGGNPGACGNYNSDSAYIVALDYRMYGGGSHCGQSVRITNNNNGQTITASVADLCPSCSSSGSLDLSVAAFQALGDMSAGVLPISWNWA